MANNLFDLSGQTVLTTGCNRGIGKAMALAMAEAGADSSIAVMLFLPL